MPTPGRRPAWHARAFPTRSRGPQRRSGLTTAPHWRPTTSRSRMDRVDRRGGRSGRLPPRVPRGDGGCAPRPAAMLPLLWDMAELDYDPIERLRRHRRALHRRDEGLDRCDGGGPRRSVRLGRRRDRGRRALGDRDDHERRPARCVLRGVGVAAELLARRGVRWRDAPTREAEGRRGGSRRPGLEGPRRGAGSSIVVPRDGLGHAGERRVHRHAGR